MNRAVSVLYMLMDGPVPARELASRAGVGDRQMANVLAGLERDGYVVRRRGAAWLADAPKTALLRDIAATMDLERLLGRSREAVLAGAERAGDASIEELARATGLSRSTIAKSVADLRSVGALVSRGGRLAVNPARPRLREFATLLRLEGERRYADGAEIIYERGSTVIRKVRAGRTARGEPTGFTAFNSHGVKYVTTHDYFCERARPVALPDILVHALLEASRTRMGAEVIMCMVFYLRHRDAIDVRRVREEAGRMGLTDLWLDIEAYLGGGQPRDSGMFFPWEEFKEKLDLYEVPEPGRAPGHDGMLEELGRALDEPAAAYLLGGENMRMKGLKNSTKDCDLAVKTRGEFESVKAALVRMGYSPVTTGYSDQDASPGALLTRDSGGRIGLFAGAIMTMALLPRMTEKSDMRCYGRLRLGLLRDEHVFALKAAAGREGDIRDMASLAQAGRLDWDEILQVASEQADADPSGRAAEDMLASMSDLHYHGGVHVPVLAALGRMVAELRIRAALRGGPMPVRDVVRHAEKAGISETAARNRIDYMARSGRLSKTGERRAARVALPRESYPAGGRITAHRIRRYLAWRFALREQPLPDAAEALARDLEGIDLSEADGLIGGAVDSFCAYERERFGAGHFDAAGAARACIALADERLGSRLGFSAGGTRAGRRKDARA